MNYQNKDSDKKQMILSEEMKKRLPYVLLVSQNDYSSQEQMSTPYESRESFQSTISPNQPEFYLKSQNVNENINTIRNITNDYITSKNELLKNYTDLSNNIQTHLSDIDFIENKNDRYNYYEMRDPNVILYPETSKDIHTAILDDVNQIKLYQNSIYISTSIAIATILIATIILTKK